MAKLNFILQKHFFLLIILSTLFYSAKSQDKVPESISYQALAADENGAPVKNKEIVVEISIISGNETGELIWQELHTTTTNDMGVFNLLIGKGVTTSAGKALKFGEIKWAKNDFFVKTRVDFGTKEFGNGLTDMGTVQLQSVPYALVADTALHVSMRMADLQDVNTTGLTRGQSLTWNGSYWIPTAQLNANGTTDLTSDWVVSTKSISLAQGKLSAASFQINNTATISSIGTSINANSASNAILVTEKAIVDYVKSLSGGGGDSYWSKNGATVYNADANIAIGTNSAQEKFHAEMGTGKFLITGTYQAGGTARMFFFPNNAALRAGFIETGSTAWNKIGYFSTAFGKDCEASGNYSLSSGHKNVAEGVGSVAFGLDNTSEAAYSLSIGTKNETKFSGAYCVAFGNANTANAYNCAAIGKSNTANGESSLALGEGSTTFNYAKAAIAGGQASKVKGESSIALGAGMNAETYGEVAVGCYNTIVEGNKSGITATDRVFVVGNGSSNTSRNDALVILKNGNVSIGKAVPTQKLDVNGNIVASGSITGSSDARFKTNIKPLENSLNKILEMQGVSYKWNTTAFPERNFSNDQQIGLIAQEVEKILPEVVLTGSDGYKSVDYAKIVSVLIEAVKEQNEIISELKNQNASKTEELKVINAKVEKLSNQMETITKMIGQAADATK